MSTETWTKAQIEFAFAEYLREVNLVETDNWRALSVDDWNCLTNRHLGILLRELVSAREIVPEPPAPDNAEWQLLNKVASK